MHHPRFPKTPGLYKKFNDYFNKKIESFFNRLKRIFGMHNDD